MASDRQNINGGFYLYNGARDDTLKWCFEYIMPLKKLLRGTPKVRWKMKNTHTKSTKRRRRRTSEKHTISTFLFYTGAQPVMWWVTAPPPPPLPLPPPYKIV